MENLHYSAFEKDGAKVDSFTVVTLNFEEKLQAYSLNLSRIGI
jgi:hypothetical protein